MSELEKLKLNDEFNAYYDYEAVIRKEQMAMAKIMLQGKESLDKIMKYTGLSKKELTMLL